jgi:hypothetical protein
MPDRALQLFGFDLGAPQQPKRLAGMGRGARMGGAGDRQAPLTATAGIGRTTTHKHGGLERLERRTHKAEQLGITGPHQHPAAAVTDDRMHAVARLDDAVAQQPHLQRRHRGARGTTKA